MPSRYDLIVVGAGMLGLAHAYHAAKQKLKVLVLERSDKARGASVRNFGMAATIAQPPGLNLERSMRTKQHWLDIAGKSGIELDQCGCLFVAKSIEEMSVLQAFTGSDCASNRNIDLVSAGSLQDYSPVVNSTNLVGGMWAPEVVKVDQRQAMQKFAAWLQEEHEVEFLFDEEVRAIDVPLVETANGSYNSDRVVICSGDEFSRLFPDEFAATGVTRCQLQMLRTLPQPQNWRLGMFVLSGLSIARYGAFQDCAGMAELKQQLADQYPDHVKYGVHAIVVQENDGSITIGDSHQYGEDASNERLEEVDQLILEYLGEWITLGEPRIAERWLGHYASLPGTDLLNLEPQPGVRLVTMTNGQGMTHGLAIAEETIAKFFP